MLKKFVEEQHATYDAEAKEAVRKFWVELGYECIENPDEFGVDLLVESKGRESGCEVETKTGWHGSEFNYPTLHIPFHKKKFTKDRVTFFVLNNARSHAAVVGRNDVVKSPIVKVPNKIVPSGDYFYEIALENVEFVNLISRTMYKKPSDLKFSRLQLELSQIHYHNL